MECSPQPPNRRWKFEREASDLFEIIDDVLALRSELVAGVLGGKWQRAVLENHYAGNQIDRLDGVAVSCIDSTWRHKDLAYNFEQNVIFMANPKRVQPELPRILIVHNKFLNNKYGRPHFFQSKTVKIDEFNQVSHECHRCLRVTTIGFDDYRQGAFGAFYDYSEVIDDQDSQDKRVVINSKYQLLPDHKGDDPFSRSTEKFDSAATQDKALNTAKMILSNFSFIFTQPNN